MKEDDTERTFNFHSMTTLCYTMLQRPPTSQWCVGITTSAAPMSDAVYDHFAVTVFC